MLSRPVVVNLKSYCLLCSEGRVHTKRSPYSWSSVGPCSIFIPIEYCTVLLQFKGPMYLLLRVCIYKYILLLLLPSTLVINGEAIIVVYSVGERFSRRCGAASRVRALSALGCLDYFCKLGPDSNR